MLASQLLLSPCEAAIPARFLPFTDDAGTMLVQETLLTNHQFDECRRDGAKTLYGLVGPSKALGTLALLARSGDPEALLRKVPKQARKEFDLTKLDPGVSITSGAHTLFHVTDQPSRDGFTGLNRPRIDMTFPEALWAYDVITPGARLLTHAEWDRISGVTEGVLVATQDGTLAEGQTNINNRIGRTTDVGSYPPFRKLYDLIGNVWEWVLPDKADQNPGLRGWSWLINPDHGRVSAFRNCGRLGDRGDIGARGVLVP